MGTGVGEAMLIGAAVGATAGGAGAAIQGGDPLKGALMGGAMGGIGGGLGAGFGAAGGATAGGAGTAVTPTASALAGGAGTAVTPTASALAGSATPSAFGTLGATGTAGIAPGALSATGAPSTFAGLGATGTAGIAPGALSATGAPSTFAGLTAPTSTGIAGLTTPAATSPSLMDIARYAPTPDLTDTNRATQAGKNILGYMPGEKGFISNPRLAMIGGTSALGAMMQAERGQFGIPGGAGDYDGPLSKLKYDPDKFTASEPTYAPGSVYTPQYKTYAAEGGIMRLARGGNIDDQNGMDEPMYMAGGGTPATLAPQGLEQLMGVKGKGQSLEEMKESAALQGLTPRAYMDIYGEGIKAQQQMAKGGMSSLGGYSDGGRMLKGPGDGMSDSIPGVIGGRQPARLADGEFVVPADVVSHLGNGSTDAGAKQLYSMMDKVRKARTGKKAQGKEINPRKYMPA